MHACSEDYAGIHTVVTEAMLTYLLEFDTVYRIAGSRAGIGQLPAKIWQSFNMVTLGFNCMVCGSGHTQYMLVNTSTLGIKQN